MSRYEKFALTLVGALVLGHVLSLAHDLLIAHEFGMGTLTLVEWTQHSYTRLLVGSLVNIGCAAWLFYESKKVCFNRLVWLVFGLAFGLLGVILFYLIEIRIGRRDQEGT